MDQEIFEKNKVIIDKTVKRIENSKLLTKGKSCWWFDNDLFIEKYNGLYRVEFKKVTLGHYHSRDKTCPEYEKFHDAIYYAIENRFDKYKQSLIDNEL